MADVMETISKNFTTINTTVSPNESFTTEYIFIPPAPPYNVGITALLAILAGVTSFCTTVGNIMVVISFGLERGIRQPSNYLIASLAVTDILIGSLSMPLYTLYLLKSYWPLGQIACDLWLSLDYTVCLVSQYTVFLITLDRFCSVKVPAKYRNWRTKTKIKVMIAVTWVVPALIFFTSIMGWHHFVKSAVPQPGVCMAMFQQNELFSAILVISYYWVTLIVMFILYVGIYKVALTLHMKSKKTQERIRKVTQLSTKNSVGNGSVKHKMVDSVTETSSSTQACIDLSQREPTPAVKRKIPIANSPTEENGAHIRPPVPNSLQVEKKETDALLNGAPKTEYVESPVWKPRNSLPNISIHWDAFTGQTHHKVQKLMQEDVEQDSLCSTDSPRVTRKRHKSQNSENFDSDSETSDSEQKPKGIHQLTNLLTNLAQKQRMKTVKKKSKSENRARKALRTITFILGAFVVCWTPYHVIVLVESFCKKPNGCVNATFYEFSYWLCYMNSPINPFCYALANQQFKKAFIKILKLEYIRDWWKKR